MHHQGSLLTPWPQKMPVFSGQCGGIWTPNSPVLIKISADKRSLNQLTAKQYFFHQSSKYFLPITPLHCSWKVINLRVWMKEICTLLVKLQIIFSRMRRVNRHARPFMIQVGCPICYYQVCALDHANGGAAGLDYHLGHCHRNGENIGKNAYIGFQLCVEAFRNGRENDADHIFVIRFVARFHVQSIFFNT